MNASPPMRRTKILVDSENQHNLQMESNFVFSLQFPQAPEEACRLGDEVRQEEGVVGSQRDQRNRKHQLPYVAISEKC